MIDCHQVLSTCHLQNLQRNALRLCQWRNILRIYVDSKLSEVSVSCIIEISTSLTVSSKDPESFLALCSWPWIACLTICKCKRVCQLLAHTSWLCKWCTWKLSTKVSEVLPCQRLGEVRCIWIVNDCFSTQCPDDWINIFVNLHEFCLSSKEQWSSQCHFSSCSRRWLLYSWWGRIHISATSWLTQTYVSWVGASETHQSWPTLAKDCVTADSTCFVKSARFTEVRVVCLLRLDLSLVLSHWWCLQSDECLHALTIFLACWLISWSLFINNKRCRPSATKNIVNVDI